MDWSCAFVLFFRFPKNISNFKQKIMKDKTIAGNTLAIVSQTIYMIIDEMAHFDANWRILTHTSHRRRRFDSSFMKDWIVSFTRTYRKKAMTRRTVTSSRNTFPSFLIVLIVQRKKNDDGGTKNKLKCFFFQAKRNVKESFCLFVVKSSMIIMHESCVWHIVI